MLRRASLFVLPLSLLASMAVLAVQETATDKDTKLLQGKWRIVSAVQEGKESPGEVDKVLTVTGNNFTLMDGARLIGEGTITLDADKTPRTIDVKKKGGQDAIPGIYELKDDELKICSPKPGGGRPKTFAATADNFVMVLKRVKN